MWGLLSRCGPLSLTGSGLLLIGAAMAIDSVAVAIGSVLAMLPLVMILVGRTRFPMVRLVPVLLAALSIVWSNWLLSSTHDWGPALVAGLRVLYFVVPGVVFVSYVDPFGMGDHLGQLLRLPARPVCAYVAALQRLDDLTADWAEAERVRRIRGLAPGRGLVGRARHWTALLFTLLVEAIRKASRMTVAMEARGYSAQLRTGRPRSWAEPARWTPSDTMLTVVTGVLAAVPVVLRLLG